MSDSPQPYRVLARKYRPQSFAELIGQEAMVRTLANAIQRDRLAHAFLLTGVRGVGKTSTARLIAKALNCIGPDGQSGPTIEPCGECEPCRAIAEGRHIDVVEMDAASHTGVDDVREIIEAVRYSAVSARYKIYIIDEVHMLSRNAFNALLKTLEEPPAHVKFLFATTDPEKVRAVLQKAAADGYAVMPFPQLYERDATYIDGHAWVLPVKERTPQQRDAVFRLLKFLADNDYHWARTGHLPSFEPVIESERFNELPHRRELSKLSSIGMPLPSAVQRQFPVQDIIGEEMAAAVAGHKPVETALADAEHRVNELLFHLL